MHLACYNMELVLLGILVLGLGQRPPAMGPMLPAGVESHFATSAVQAEERLFASDFKGASKATALLPRGDFEIAWDDSKVPLALRAGFAEQRDKALAIWDGILQSHISVG